MTTSLFQNIAADVKIRMSSAIVENHTVTFATTPGVTVNSGSSLVFTAANYNTDQNLNITVSDLGTKNIPYTVTSPYSQRTKTGVVTITVAAEQTNFALTQQYIGFPRNAPGDPVNYFRNATLPVATITAPAYNKSYTLRVKAGQSLTGFITFYVFKDGVLQASGTAGSPLTFVTSTTGTWEFRTTHSDGLTNNTNDIGAILVECVNNTAGSTAEFSLLRARVAVAAGSTFTLNGQGTAPCQVAFTGLPVFTSIIGVSVVTASQVWTQIFVNFNYSNAVHTPHAGGTADFSFQANNYSGLGPPVTGTALFRVLLGARFLFPDNQSTYDVTSAAQHDLIFNS